ncbi:MAG: 2-aminoethylphosphonate--pyruvate transaminase [Alphaproteobacteria bacterium]|jgi:2-aminoethylphosphonate-pyruvate transaminase|nr:2-aminoethylphosphonate--pyruvate transaminase [Alphaproteobacteria bacterium]MDP7173188.1 2-aminoethylphosphonate--pyruvate transaminase [Alphaproteobacteria bacterium]MDP7234787.1 2-aminoethylphosphonate--pyruvate transaminase [Alphaproteobacteria bacterium]MDP7487479.1 2-aminoethylphosphonate--pyruvate transaminase [Alphaproteobacteria bacterium]MEE1544200.1 2-aminoethylphosphonate--pyruvate transaminase [Alphaproteobacteria bacterium]
MSDAERNDGPGLLLTPGPLTTSERTRNAMTRDWGSRDSDFIGLTARVRHRLTALANAESDYTCVLLQGSGTFVVEAMIASLVPPDGKMLVAVNGAYGQRIATIGKRLGRNLRVVDSPEDEPSDVAALRAALATYGPFSHIVAVHCETTSGVLNPLTEIAEAAREHGAALLVDMMSAFGAIPIDTPGLGITALAASANKCLEGVPGMGFLVAETSQVAAAKGNAESLSLDIYDQWQNFENNGQWRFTPPTHVMAALDAALDQLAEEGGVARRGARYAENCRRLVAGMRRLGFETLLDDANQAPIIITFRMPDWPGFTFGRFYDALHERGFVIYPGKITAMETFRIGCIGALTPADMDAAVEAVAAVLKEMGILDP